MRAINHQGDVGGSTSTEARRAPAGAARPVVNVPRTSRSWFVSWNRRPTGRIMYGMDRDRPDAAARRGDELAALKGEVHALRAVTAVLIAHLALLGRDPHARREEILRSLEAMLPHALAQIEHDAPAAAAAGFERAVETVTRLARTAVRFEPVTPAGRGAAAKRPSRRHFEPGA
jgi:hypothetical protein